LFVSERYVYGIIHPTEVFGMTFLFSVNIELREEKCDIKNPNIYINATSWKVTGSIPDEVIGFFN
jgi:hypothetical protein